MLSKDQLEALIGDYGRVFKLIQEAGNILLDNQAHAVEVTGRHGAMSSAALSSALADLIANVYGARSQMIRRLENPTS